MSNPLGRKATKGRDCSPVAAQRRPLTDMGTRPTGSIDPQLNQDADLIRQGSSMMQGKVAGPAWLRSRAHKQVEANVEASLRDHNEGN